MAAASARARTPEGVERGRRLLGRLSRELTVRLGRHTKVRHKSAGILNITSIESGFCSNLLKTSRPGSIFFVYACCVHRQLQARFLQLPRHEAYPVVSGSADRSRLSDCRFSLEDGQAWRRELWMSLAKTWTDDFQRTAKGRHSFFGMCSNCTLNKCALLSSSPDSN